MPNHVPRAPCPHTDRLIIAACRTFIGVSPYRAQTDSTFGLHRGRHLFEAPEQRGSTVMSQTGRVGRGVETGATAPERSEGNGPGRGSHSGALPGKSGRRDWGSAEEQADGLMGPHAQLPHATADAGRPQPTQDRDREVGEGRRPGRQRSFADATPVCSHGHIAHVEHAVPDAPQSRRFSSSRRSGAACSADRLVSRQTVSGSRRRPSFPDSACRRTRRDELHAAEARVRHLRIEFVRNPDRADPDESVVAAHAGLGPEHSINIGTGRLGKPTIAAAPPVSSIRVPAIAEVATACGAIFPRH